MWQKYDTFSNYFLNEVVSKKYTFLFDYTFSFKRKSMRRRLVNFGELKNRLSSPHQAQNKGKLSVKILKDTVEDDLIIKSANLPINYTFHTLNINIKTPPKTGLILEIRNTKTKDLLNTGIALDKPGISLSEIRFYTTHPTVDLHFKLMKVKGGIDFIGKTFHINKMFFESEQKMPKINKLNNVSIKQQIPNNYINCSLKSVLNLEEQPIFNLIKPLHGYGRLQNFLTVLNQLCLPRFLSILTYENETHKNKNDRTQAHALQKEVELYYNLYFLLVNNYNEDTTNKSPSNDESLLLLRRDLYEFKEKYSHSHEKRLSIHTLVINLRHQLQELKEQWDHNQNEIQQRVIKSSLLQQKNSIISQSLSEKEQLLSLKNLLLRELNKTKKIQKLFDEDQKKEVADEDQKKEVADEDQKKEVADEGQKKEVAEVDEGSNNESTKTKSEFQFMCDTYYKKIGSDLIKTDQKIRSYEDIIDKMKHEALQDKATIEINLFEQNKKGIINEATALKQQLQEYSIELNTEKLKQYQLLGKIVSTIIELKLNTF